MDKGWNVWNHDKIDSTVKTRKDFGIVSFDKYIGDGNLQIRTTFHRCYVYRRIKFLINQTETLEQYCRLSKSQVDLQGWIQEHAGIQQF